MKRKFTVALSLLLCLLMTLSILVTTPVAAEAENTLSGEASRTTEELTLEDGAKTGVKLTNIQLDGFYGSDREVYAAEFSLANPHLSLEVINSGTDMVDAKTLDTAAKQYNNEHNGQTVLAAVNGDLWMTKIHSSDAVTSTTLKVTRGVLIIDGEIWASQQIDAENAGATNEEKGTPAGNKMAFGVTSRNQPLMGSPDIKVTLSVNGAEITADGLNRLPALNSLIVYNHRCNETNYVLNDAYEVELEVAASSAFKANGEMTAIVKGIYPAGSTERPAIGEKTVMLTARGSKINTLKNNFNVGDEVTFSTTMTDRMGRTELWQDVQDAIGGHMQAMVDGRQGISNSSTAAYPTALIGYKDDGSVMLVTVTSTLDGSRAALKYNQAYQFCREMGYNSVFYLDGGGSTTFVTLKEGAYTVRNKCSDGSPRPVINGVGVVWNEEPVCEKQGSLDYIEIPVDLTEVPPTFMDGALLSELFNGETAISGTYDETEKAYRMTTTVTTNDPYANLSFSALRRVNAEDYPYMIFKVKTDRATKSNMVLYYATGAATGADPARTVVVPVQGGIDDWQYLVVDMSEVSKWTGIINSLRVDIFDSISTPAGQNFYIGYIMLCADASEAMEALSDPEYVPEGAIGDYLAYKESLKPVATKAPTTPMTENPTEPMVTTVEPVTEAPAVSTKALTEPMATTTEPKATATTTDEIAVITVTSAKTEVPTAASTITPKEGGCGSTIAMSGLSIMAIAIAAAYVVRMRKN